MTHSSRVGDSRSAIRRLQVPAVFELMGLPLPTARDRYLIPAFHPGVASGNIIAIIFSSAFGSLSSWAAIAWACSPG